MISYSRIVVPALLLVAGLGGLSPVWAQKGDGDGALIAEGRRIVIEKCASCHNVEKSGASTFAPAPPFRTLSAKYPLSHLAEALAEGITTGHPAMPEFVFSLPEIDAILTYIDTLGRDVPRVPPK